MDRRDFLTCSVASAALSAFDALAQSPTKQYTRTRLTNAQGDPIKASTLMAETNYIFMYPFAATPCLLLNLGKPHRNPAALKTKSGQTYGWSGGVGAQHSLVAYSAICAHKLAYPAREVSFIRFQKDKSKDSDSGMIHCCADHSVYDPAAGAKVVTGPAPEPLAIITLEYEAATDGIYATGTLGPEQFVAFFKKYSFKLDLEYSGRANQPVREKTTLSSMANYCKNIVQC